MPRREYKRILSRGMLIWNQWRLDNPSLIPDFSYCFLDGADLRNADLREAILYCACLQDARLDGADLSGADLGGSNLAGARLGGANLSGCQCLTQTQINEAMGDENTTLPDGLTRPARWLSPR